MHRWSLKMRFFYYFLSLCPKLSMSFWSKHQLEYTVWEPRMSSFQRTYYHHSPLFLWAVTQKNAQVCFLSQFRAQNGTKNFFLNPPPTLIFEEEYFLCFLWRKFFSRNNPVKRIYKKLTFKKWLFFVNRIYEQSM